MRELLNYIGGELVAAVSGRLLDDVDPAIGEVIARVPDSDADDVQRAVAAARAAFPACAATPAAERARILRRIAAAIEAHLPDLPRADSIDTGKPLAVARAIDIPR